MVSCLGMRQCNQLYTSRYILFFVLLQHSREKQAIGLVMSMKNNSDLRGLGTLCWEFRHLGTWLKKQLLKQLKFDWASVGPSVKDCLSQKLSPVLRGAERENVSLSKSTHIIISSLWAEFSLFLWELQLCEDYRSSCRRCSQVPLVLIQRGMSEKIIWSLTLIFDFVEEQLLANSLPVYFPSSIRNSFEQSVIQHRVSISVPYSWHKILLSRVNLNQ